MLNKCGGMNGSDEFCLKPKASLVFFGMMLLLVGDRVASSDFSKAREGAVTVFCDLEVFGLTLGGLFLNSSSLREHLNFILPLGTIFYLGSLFSQYWLSGHWEQWPVSPQI